MINGAKLIVVSGLHDEAYITRLLAHLSRHDQAVCLPRKESFPRSGFEVYDHPKITTDIDSNYQLYLALQRLAFLDQIMPALREGRTVVTDIPFFPNSFFDRSQETAAEYTRQLKDVRDHYNPDLAFQILLSDHENDTHGNGTVRLVRQHNLATHVLGLYGSQDEITQRILHEVDHNR